MVTDVPYAMFLAEAIIKEHGPSSRDHEDIFCAVFGKIIKNVIRYSHGV
jgi:hypothetical protein